MISIIIPTLNEEKTIGATLAYLKALNLPHEIIVSDGQSRDRTREIAAAAGARVIAYQGTERQTIAGGRNLGAAAATGDFLVFLDADVIIPEINKFFDSALKLFQAYPKLLGLTARQLVAPERATWGDKLIFGTVNLVYLFLNNFIRFGGSGGEFQMIRARAFRELGGYNEKMPAGEDNDLFQRLAKRGRTHLSWRLVVNHSGRRGHKVGLPRLVFEWLANWFAVFAFKRSYNKEWQEVR